MTARNQNKKIKVPSLGAISLIIKFYFVNVSSSMMIVLWHILLLTVTSFNRCTCMIISLYLYLERQADVLSVSTSRNLDFSCKLSAADKNIFAAPTFAAAINLKNVRPILCARSYGYNCVALWALIALLCSHPGFCFKGSPTLPLPSFCGVAVIETKPCVGAPLTPTSLMIITRMIFLTKMVIMPMVTFVFNSDNNDFTQFRHQLD